MYFLWAEKIKKKLGHRLQEHHIFTHIKDWGKIKRKPLTQDQIIVKFRTYHNEGLLYFTEKLMSTLAAEPFDPRQLAATLCAIHCCSSHYNLCV